MAKKMAEIPLGKHAEYPKEFDSGLLYAIPRAQARNDIGLDEPIPFIGYDQWTLYELCWLDSSGSPQMSVVDLRVPADSTSIVESKSLKLYANSLYYQRFDSSESVKNQISKDLNRCLETEVNVQLIDLSTVQREQTHYQPLDEIIVDPIQAADKAHLEPKASTKPVRYCTKRFRSLCPVTGQPDWASIYVRLDGIDVAAESLAQYLAGFSEHQGFHENCVERIYMELQAQLQPSELSVAARYTRRGGIDINPIRASSWNVLEMPAREPRQ